MYRQCLFLLMHSTGARSGSSSGLVGEGGCVEGLAGFLVFFFFFFFCAVGGALSEGGSSSVGEVEPEECEDRGERTCGTVPTATSRGRDSAVNVGELAMDVCGRVPLHLHPALFRQHPVETPRNSTHVSPILFIATQSTRHSALSGRFSREISTQKYKAL